MKKKLQIFISSTFSDLQIERQAAVETVLRAGHIPAGMELFSAGSESQLEIIKRWIDESDVYMLILGGRYGSIEGESGLSYTEIEYRYALEKNKPVFAIIASDSLMSVKVKESGLDVVERVAIGKYGEFRTLVLSKICRFFDDSKEIKISIFESLLDIQDRYQLKGWVKFDDVPDLSALMNQISSLQGEIDSLKLEKKVAPVKQASKVEQKGEYLFSGLNFHDLAMVLENKKITIPASATSNGNDFTSTYFNLLITNSGKFNTGIKGNANSGSGDWYLYKVASEIMVFGLIEQTYVKQGQVTVSVLKTSSDGMKFIAEYNLRNYKQNNPVKPEVAP